jgi:hypothetical protein
MTVFNRVAGAYVLTAAIADLQAPSLPPQGK